MTTIGHERRHAGGAGGTGGGGSAVSEPKERPILFSGPMIRAILADTKTQTRRVVKPAPCLTRGMQTHEFAVGGHDYRCPYGVPGDRLWVRETFADGVEGCPGGISYRANHCDPKGDGPAHPMKWRPSIFMPRAASRILLEVTDVRVERLQEISEGDAKAEGITELSLQGDEPGAWWTAAPHRSMHSRTPRGAFLRLWRSIHGDGSWDANPWVWVVSFRRIDGGVAA